MNDARPLPQIGRCLGCNRSRRLEDGVCGACLQGRGRAWAERAHRVRTEPAFALAVYCEIGSERGRDLFVSLFGRPWLPETEKAVASLRNLMARVGWRPASEPAVAMSDGIALGETRAPHARTTRGQ